MALMSLGVTVRLNDCVGPRGMQGLSLSSLVGWQKRCQRHQVARSLSLLPVIFSQAISTEL
jgi:hypothetical protein